MSDQFGPLLDRTSEPQRPGFRDELWSTLSDEWNGIETATVTSSPAVSDLSAARRRRRTAIWMTAGLAAAAAAVAAVVVTANRPSTIKVTPGTDPEVTQSVADPSPTTTNGDAATVSTAAPATSPAPLTIEVGDVTLDDATIAEQALDTETIYIAGIGSAPDQLGREKCQECEPATPGWAVELGDGSILVDDPFNHRLVVIRDGVPIAVPVPADVITEGPATVAGDRVGIPVIPNDSNVKIVGHVIDASALADGRYVIVSTTEGERLVESPNDIMRRAMSVMLYADHTQPVAVEATPWSSSEPRVITVSLSGLQRRWTMPSAWYPNGDPVVQADGSVMVPLGNESRGRFLVRLARQGPATLYSGVTGEVRYATSLPVTMTTSGFLAVESTPTGFRVVRQTIPSASAVPTAKPSPNDSIPASATTTAAPTTPAPVDVADIAAPWPTSAATRRNPATVVAPLVTAAIDGLVVERSGAFAFNRGPDDDGYSQWFANADFTKVLQVTTQPGTASAAGREWTVASPRLMLPGYASVDLSNEGGTVHLRSVGMTGTDLQTIIPKLSLRRGGAAGWSIRDQSELVMFAEGWSGDPDQFIVVERDNARVAEIHTGLALIDGLGWSPVASEAPTVSTLNGRTVLRFANSLTTLMLGDDPGTPVVVGATNLDEATFAQLLGSITLTTDAAAYDALPENVVDPNQDGCGESLFC